jgi:hypothetical protein
VIKVCVILYLGLGGGTFGAGLYQLADGIRALHSRATVVEFWQDASFAVDCQAKVLIGHSLGAGAALRKASKEKVDEVIVVDPMGFDPNSMGRPSGRLRAYYACGPHVVVRGSSDQVCYSGGHVGIASNPTVQRKILARIRQLSRRHVVNGPDNIPGGGNAIPLP